MPPSRAAVGLKLQVPNSILNRYNHALDEQGQHKEEMTPPRQQIARCERLICCVQDKTLLLDNPAAPVKKHEPGRHSSQVSVLSGVKLKKLGLHTLPLEECRCKSQFLCHLCSQCVLNKSLPGVLAPTFAPTRTGCTS